eukprot:COSAG02_NODE_34444_length_484_cov_0.750649_1_plen_88_part_00
MKTQGAAPGIRAHPHVVMWQQVGGLVYDGVQYAKATVGGAQQHGSDTEGALSATLARAATDDVPPSPVAATGGEAVGSDSDDDSLVE